MLGHLRLVEQDRAFGIDPAGDESGGHFQRALPQLGRIVWHGNRVQIGEKIEGLAPFRQLILHPHPIADRAEIISEVEIAGGLDAGNDAHEKGLLLGF